MIITLTLNPAIDKTIEIDNFTINRINRVSAARLDAGGKGINVSKAIHGLGEKSKALGVLAGRSGEFIKEQVDLLDIENQFLFIEGETRTNIKIVDRQGRTNTDINERGPDLSLEELSKIKEIILEALKKDDILVLSGSVPGGVSPDIYKIIIKEAKRKGAKVILDADGQLLKLGIEAGPYLVKPNIHELERLYNKRIESVEEAIELAKDIFHYDVAQILVSLGEDGAVLLTREKIYRVQGMKVPVISTVGAGDAMVAALAVAANNGYSLEKTLRLSAAASAASVMTPGTQPGKREVIAELEKIVSFEERLL